MKIKKIFAVGLSIAMAVSMCSCAKKDNEANSVEETTTAQETTAAEETTTAEETTKVPETTAENTAAVENNANTDASEDAQGVNINPLLQAIGALDVDESVIGELMEGTCWAGVDDEGNTYAVEIGSDDYSLVIQDSQGNQETYSGQYLVDAAEGFSFFDGDDLTNALEDFSFNLVLDGAEPYVEINGACLTLQDSEENLEALLQEFDAAALVSSYLANGHCWIACTDTHAFVLFLNGQEMQMQVLELVNGTVQVEEIAGAWNMDPEELIIFDFTTHEEMDFDWTYEQEEELAVLTLELDDEEMEFYQVSAENIQDGTDMAATYLENHQAAENSTDIETLLTGYEGVSIVDAFVLAGLNPSFENRAEYAKKLGIENYRGTAKQNLSMIEMMGGKVVE